MCYVEYRIRKKKMKRHNVLLKWIEQQRRKIVVNCAFIQKKNWWKSIEKNHFQNVSKLFCNESVNIQQISKNNWSWTKTIDDEIVFQFDWFSENFQNAQKKTKCSSKDERFTQRITSGENVEYRFQYFRVSKQTSIQNQRHNACLSSSHSFIKSFQARQETAS